MRELRGRGGGRRRGRAVRRESKLGDRVSYEAIGFLDDDCSRNCQMLQDCRVLGKVGSLSCLVRNLRITKVMVAIPSARGTESHRIVELASSVGVRTCTDPSVTEIASGRIE